MNPKNLDNIFELLTVNYSIVSLFLASEVKTSKIDVTLHTMHMICTTDCQTSEDISFSP